MRPTTIDHQSYMSQALKQAHKAYSYDEVPIGAVVVNTQGAIIGRGYNQVEKRKVQTAHAELLAITQACKKKDDWRLDGCWLYVTLEPCLMCMGLSRLSRIAGIVYGADSKLFSYRLDMVDKIPLYNKNIIIIGGVQAEQSINLLREFFKKKRI